MHLAFLDAAPAAEEFPVGCRVFLQADHPWAGYYGFVIAHETPGLMPQLGPLPKVKLDNGHECFIMQAHHARRLP